VGLGHGAYRAAESGFFFCGKVKSGFCLNHRVQRETSLMNQKNLQESARLPNYGTNGKKKEPTHKEEKGTNARSS